MKILDRSILELLLVPVFKLPWMKSAGEIRQPYHYEHAYTLPLVALMTFHVEHFGIYLFLIASFCHVILKEVIFDWHKNKDNLAQLWVDLTTRVYGFLIGLIFFALR